MSTSEKFLYLVAGTGIGAALGILFAPRSGQEIRDTLASQGRQAMDAVSNKVEEGKRYIQEKGGAGATVRNMVDRGKQTLNESVEGVKNRLNESIEAGKQEYQGQRATRPMDRTGM